MIRYLYTLSLVLGVVLLVPDCWYRAEYCSVDTGEEVMIDNTSASIPELAEQCYQLCHQSQECQEFTLISDSHVPRCYHFQQPCTRVVDDPCISQRCCISGPGSCEPAPAKTCTRLVTNEPHYMSWQCVDEDGDRIDQATTQVSAGTVCYLRYEKTDYISLYYPVFFPTGVHPG